MNFTDIFQKMDSLKDELSEHRPFTEGELERLREDFMINFTYNSNAIEGNTLTLDETALVIKEGLTVGGKSLREHLETIGHRDAWLYVEELVKEKAEISERIIKDVHSIVLMDRKGDAGIYRRLPVMITGSPAELPEPSAVPYLVEQLVYDYSNTMDDYHPTEKIARFHLLFESIHPFIDGNGRTGRLLLNMELMKEGYPPIDIKFTDREKYIDAFKVWHLEGSADDMTELVASYTMNKLENYLGMLEVAEEIELEQGDFETTMEPTL